MAGDAARRRGPPGSQSHADVLVARSRGVAFAFAVALLPRPELRRAAKGDAGAAGAGPQTVVYLPVMRVVMYYELF